MLRVKCTSNVARSLLPYRKYVPALDAGFRGISPRLITRFAVVGIKINVPLAV
jgi:hypothetical protein